MKYLPIPFLIIAILAGMMALWSNFVPTTSDVKKEAMLPPPSPSPDKVFSRLDSLSTGLDKSFSDLSSTSQKVYEESKKLAKPSPGGSVPQAAETGIEINQQQIELETTKRQVEELIGLLRNEVIMRVQLEAKLAKTQSSSSETNYSFAIAFVSLLVSVIAMLPSWIQLFRKGS